MQERDPLSFSSETRLLVDQSNSGSTAPLERRIQVVDGEANVMNSGSALCHEFPNRRFVGLGLEEFDQGFACRQSGDSSPIGIVERHLRHGEDVSIERQDLVQRAYRNPDMGDPGAAASRITHSNALRFLEAET